MINSLLWKQSNFIKRFSNKLLLTPIDIPIVILSLFVHPIGQTLLDAVSEVSFKFDLVAR